MHIGAMTLRQKIGQMVHCGFDGHEPSEDVLRLIRDGHIGGVILFARNVRDIRQVAALNAALQRAAVESGHPSLFISIDQEGGMVARLTDGVALMPGNMAIAAGGSPEAAYKAALIAGRELKALGINVNLAPVVDVNNNPDNPVIGVRSFGESPELVAEFGEQAVRGYREAGVAVTLKHFPGHGDTTVDSHLDLPVISHSRERIESVELVPFRRAIAAGADCVMSAHVYFPAYEEKKLPATLSRNVLTGLLRETLGFDGVIMTDSMGMKAISDHYGSVEATVMAVEAGADCILIAHGHDVQWAAIEALVEAVRSGRIPESRIDRSVERLLALKQKLGLTAESVVTAADEAYFATESFRRVGSAEHMRVAQSISEASVTLVKDEPGFLPLQRDVRTFVVTVRPDAMTEADERYDLPVTLGRALAAQGFDTVERVLPLADVKRHASEVAAQAAAFDQIVVGTYNASLNPDQADLVRAIRAHGKRLTVVALRNPYDLRAFPDVPAYVALYESRPLALQSAAKVLAGTIPARGRLPVTIGDRYPAGWGMTRE